MSCKGNSVRTGCSVQQLVNALPANAQCDLETDVLVPATALEDPVAKESARVVSPGHGDSLASRGKEPFAAAGSVPAAFAPSRSTPRSLEDGVTQK